MKFVEMDPRYIEPSPWNSNVVSHENEEKLRASVERLGMFKPIIVREIASPVSASNPLGQPVIQCIGGWHRCEQAIELGYGSVPCANLGEIDDAKAKEISLADNARYGLDDTLKLSGLLEDMDLGAIETFMPWTNRDIEAMTASVAVSIADLDLDDVTLPDDEDDEPETDVKPAKQVKTHQVVKFRLAMTDAARVSALINQTMKAEGFTAEDDMTNAGEALAFLLLKGSTNAIS